MIDRDVPRSSTGELLRCRTGWLGNLERVARTLTPVQILYPRNVKLSNRTAHDSP